MKEKGCEADGLIGNDNTAWKFLLVFINPLPGSLSFEFTLTLRASKFVPVSDGLEP